VKIKTDTKTFFINSFIMSHSNSSFLFAMSKSLSFYNTRLA
jgi:hypothetical protein